jgi:YHS domain-containing protein
MTEPRSIDPNEDPVCGMQVDPETARARGLTHTYEGREYLFCGKGCLLDFRDAPDMYLEEGYQPSM